LLTLYRGRSSFKETVGTSSKTKLEAEYRDSTGIRIQARFVVFTIDLTCGQSSCSDNVILAAIHLVNTAIRRTQSSTTA
jgi:hypothetical protein